MSELHRIMVTLSTGEAKALAKAAADLGDANDGDAKTKRALGIQTQQIQEKYRQLAYGNPAAYYDTKQKELDDARTQATTHYGSLIKMHLAAGMTKSEAKKVAIPAAKAYLKALEGVVQTKFPHGKIDDPMAF